jgi:serine/threonine protein kinase
MERNHWTQIEGILQATLDQPAHLRSEFLHEACGGDEALRKEVASFLDSHEDSDGFLETPAITVAARALAAEKTSFIGSMIGPYRIVKAIGAGGMGEVFLAQDTRLHRQIAVKILPAEFAADPARVQRFEQEARAAGALNHPNVLVVHDTGVHNGVPYIASEFLQGETLRDRISRGQLPLAKALDFALQIARALAAAHENGIVHRDLKPENIFVTTEGRIKILDFGIAKLIEPSPQPQFTLTSPGVVLGTVGYLSPEQVRGQTSVLSSDIFAFGCVFYEMLTGQRAFAKDSHAETMTAILREETPESTVLSSLPPALVRTLSHCLEKSPAERFQSARDLAFTLETLSVSPNQAVSRRSRAKPTLAWLVAALLAIAALALFVLLLNRKPPESSVLRFEIPVPGDPVTGSPALAISPDGKQIAFMAMGSKGKPILWTRAMNTIAPIPVSGSEDARYPFWSGDSRFLAFQVGDRLKALNMATGNQRTICTIRGILNATWNADNVILASTGNGPLVRIAPDGGQSMPVTNINTAAGQRSHWWPNFLPDNRHFLYTVNASTLDKSGVFVGSLDHSEPKLLISGVITNAACVSSGYLLYSREGNLISRHFDASRLEVTGPEVTIVEKLKTYYGYTAFSASQTGTLVFRAGDQSRYQLAWFDRTGKRLGPVEDEAEKKWSEGILPLSPSLSPDGTQLATVQYQPSNGAYGIWVSALTRANLEFPVTETRNAEFAVWSPDGNRIAYSASPNGGARDLYIKRLDETGNGKLVYHSATDKWPLDWSSEGGTLLFLQNDQQGRSDLWVSSLAEDAAPPPTAVPGAPSEVKQARFSPDGHWLAYSSEQSGSSIIYVQDFPRGGMRLPISGRGSTDPQWRHDGRELFYLSAQNELMSVPIAPDSAGGLSAGVPKLLFKTAVAGVSPYTVTPDGQRFLLQLPTQDTATPVISVIVNRFAAGRK